MNSPPTPELIQRLRACRLFVFDFDGVMTDNRVLISESGTEAVFCNRSDGLAIGYMRKAGRTMAILSTETNPVVRARADKLSLPVIQGSKDKRQSLADLCAREHVGTAETCFVGNDVNDLPALDLAGVKACPADAYPQVRDMCDLVIPVNGGAGVIRHLADLLGDMAPQPE